MHITDFIRKWKQTNLTERAGSQEHFLDLCDVLGQKKPAEADPEGKWYAFEKRTEKHSGGSSQGFADVWRKGYFAWEYKGPDKDLKKAYNQLLLYRGALENPPLLVVSDMQTIEIHTNFTNTPDVVHILKLEELDKPENIQKLKWLFTNPEQFKPGTTSEQITAEVARKFAELAQVLRNRNHPPQHVAHFLSKLVFCLFAEDVGLLPKQILTSMIEGAGKDTSEFNEMLKDLLVTMNTGGRFGHQKIRWFNGGLFNDDITIPLEAQDIALLGDASRLDWTAVEPSILGTLFERGLDPSKRSQLGAHYTPRSDIERIINPVMADPLEQEWQAIIQEIDQSLAKAEASENKGTVTKARNKARELIETFLKTRVRAVKVLDPACGSGNFLYIALEKLHNLEKVCMVKLADVEGGQLSPFVEVGPHQVMGIELNPYAAELARVTIWIGHLQWMIQNGFGYAENPVLQTLETIQCRDAVMDLSQPDQPQIPEWPTADFIIGNPPFLGDKKMLGELGDEYTRKLRKLWATEVPGQADLVCYWFAHARMQLEAGKAERIGLVATNSIRGGKNRFVLDRIVEKGRIFAAWSDEPWVVDGAAIRISLVCFAQKTEAKIRLNGNEVEEIHSDLTGMASLSLKVDLTHSKKLNSNIDVSFIGTQKNGKFDISGEQAREWLKATGNPNGKPNSDVLKPWMNGMDITRRASGNWIIDFALMPEEDAELYEAPFEYARQLIKPERDKQRRESRKRNWWLLGEPMPKMRKVLGPFSRFIVTPRVAKYRLFAWVQQSLLPDCQLVAIARDDDTTFGILHSRFHELWALRMGTSLEDRPRYTPSTTFETFPFPEGLTPNLKPQDYSNPHAEAIASAARRLNELRDNWLNPADLVQRVPEVVPGYPDRILPKDDEAAKELKKRTLTNLYNQKPAWLLKAHQRLDEAVAAAYGWPADLSDDGVLGRLFELNQARAGKAMQADAEPTELG